MQKTCTFSKQNQCRFNKDKKLIFYIYESVSEHLGWVRNVVLRYVYSGSGKPQRVGISGGEGPDGQMRERKGQFTSNPRERWMIPVTARRVLSK
jgi:hypothetical protein